MTLSNENAVYACLNYGEAFCSGELEDRSICFQAVLGVLYLQWNRSSGTSPDKADA